MPDIPPTGTITLVFTDIQGSTALWEHFGDDFKALLDLHNTLFRAAIAEFGGYEVKTEGDAFMVAFGDAQAAVSMCLAMQERLREAEWPDALNDDAVCDFAGTTDDGCFRGLRVRMGAHTGTPDCQPDPVTGRMDYLGSPVNRAARVSGAGHGGQVLLSGVAADLAQGHLPEQAALLSLGTHRLRDLSTAEDVSQLLHPELSTEFPPILSLDYFQGNLPPQLTNFIGREEEITEVNGLLNNTRILTLTGIGGAGKTRLALEIGVQGIEEYADGVWLVDLAPLTDPAMVRSTIALTFGILEEGMVLTT